MWRHPYQKSCHYQASKYIFVLQTLTSGKNFTKKIKIFYQSWTIGWTFYVKYKKKLIQLKIILLFSKKLKNN